MVALTEQSVCTSLPMARPSVHMLLNSPLVAAQRRRRGQTKHQGAREGRTYVRSHAHLLIGGGGSAEILSKYNCTVSWFGPSVTPVTLVTKSPCGGHVSCCPGSA